MPIQFACPSCNKQLKISNPAMAGKKLKCPRCGAVITAPATEDDAPSTPIEAAKEISAPKPPPEAVEELRPAPPSVPPARSAARDDEMEDDELEERVPPRRRLAPQSAAAHPGMGVPIMVAIICLLYIGALVAVFLGLANTLLLGDVSLSKARVGERDNRDGFKSKGAKGGNLVNPLPNRVRFDPAAFKQRETQRTLAGTT